MLLIQPQQHGINESMGRLVTPLQMTAAKPYSRMHRCKIIRYSYVGMRVQGQKGNGAKERRDLREKAQA